MSDPSTSGPMNRKCPCCGSGELIEGTAAGNFPLTFFPKGIGYFGPAVLLKALQCCNCGNVQFYASIKTAKRSKS